MITIMMLTTIRINIAIIQFYYCRCCQPNRGNDISIFVSNSEKILKQNHNSDFMTYGNSKIYTYHCNLITKNVTLHNFIHGMILQKHIS